MKFIFWIDSKIKSTHDSSSIVQSYAIIVSSKAFKFCSLSVIGSAQSALYKKSPKFHFNEGLLKSPLFLMITVAVINIKHQFDWINVENIRCVEKLATLNHRKKCLQQRLSLCYDSELSWRQIIGQIFHVNSEVLDVRLEQDYIGSKTEGKWHVREVLCYVA